MWSIHSNTVTLLTFKVLLLFLINFLFQLFLPTHFPPPFLSFNKICSPAWSESHYEHHTGPKFRDLPDCLWSAQIKGIYNHAWSWHPSSHCGWEDTSDLYFTWLFNILPWSGIMFRRKFCLFWTLPLTAWFGHGFCRPLSLTCLPFPFPATLSLH